MWPPLEQGLSNWVLEQQRLDRAMVRRKGGKIGQSYGEQEEKWRIRTPEFMWLRVEKF